MTSNSLTYLSVHHTDNFTRLVVDDSLLLDIIQSWDSESSLVIWAFSKINILQVGVFLMTWNWIWSSVISRRIFILRGDESPSYI